MYAVQGLSGLGRPEISVKQQPAWAETLNDKSPRDLELELRRRVAKYLKDPLGFAKFIYPWKRGELNASDGPRSWQASILGAIGAHLKDKATRYTPLQIAVASGHGIGKSALVGQIIGWAMSTCDDCKVIVTAATGTQLATKTAPEVAKWFRIMGNRHWFEVMATSIKVQERGSTWRTDFITWSENNTEAFQGAHNKGKRILIIMDEASAIADKVWEATEGALTDSDTEIIWLAFGNPTQNTGRFRECFGKNKHRWLNFQIDSRTVEGTNKEQLDKWVSDYGEDSDFVRVRVRGEFPRAGSNQLINSDAVEAARRFKASGYEGLPKIMSVDVARFGDDQSVIGIRQGRYLRILAKYRGLDTVQLAERVIEQHEMEKPDAVVVDGDGIGAGVVDQLKHRRYDKGLFEFHGGEKANDSEAYFNKRAECWALTRDWLMAGAQIPDDPELATDLTSPEYGFSNKQQIQLERKEDMKKRGLSSPDSGDMLAMTFSVKIAPKPKDDTRPPRSWESSRGASTSWMGV